MRFHRHHPAPVPLWVDEQKLNSEASPKRMEIDWQVEDEQIGNYQSTNNGAPAPLSTPRGLWGLIIGAWI